MHASWRKYCASLTSAFMRLAQTSMSTAATPDATQTIPNRLLVNLCGLVQSHSDVLCPHRRKAKEPKQQSIPIAHTSCVRTRSAPSNRIQKYSAINTIPPTVRLLRSTVFHCIWDTSQTNPAFAHYGMILPRNLVNGGVCRAAIGVRASLA